MVLLDIKRTEKKNEFMYETTVKAREGREVASFDTAFPVIFTRLNHTFPGLLCCLVSPPVVPFVASSDICLCEVPSEVLVDASLFGQTARGCRDAAKVFVDLKITTGPHVGPLHSKGHPV